MDRIRFNLEGRFRDTDQENLYSDVNIHDHHIVEAQYMRRDGFEDDPDICAIPRCPTEEEIKQLTNVYMIDYDPDKAEGLTKKEKLEQSSRLAEVMCPLAIHFELAKAVDRCLISSYRHRQTMEGIVYTSGKTQARLGGIISEPRDGAMRTENLYVVGKTSYGKSMARKMIISNIYPKAIHHEFEDKSYTQIPILEATSVVGNMYCYYEQITQRIDEVLNTGDMYYSYFKSEAKSNIGRATGVIKRYIKLFHVGALLIEECEFLRGSEVLEDLINLSEDTGVAIIIIGNPKSEVRSRSLDLMDRPRIHMRFQNVIRADDISSKSNRIFLRLAAKTLWDYQWTPFIPLNDEMCDILMEYSVYNICILKALIKKLMDTVIEKKKKTLSPDLIREVGDKYFLKAKCLLDEDPEALLKYIENDIYGKNNDDIPSIAANYDQIDIDSRKTKAVISQAFQAIRVVTDPEKFSDIRIMQAVRNVIAKDMSLISVGVSAVATKALTLLNDNQEKSERMAAQKLERMKKVKPVRKLEKEAIDELHNAIAKPTVNVG